MIEQADKTIKKGLFINHGWGYYGGERSLATLLRHSSGIDQTLIMPLSISKNKLINPFYFFPTVRAVKSYSLPRFGNYFGAPLGTLFPAKTLIKNFIWRLIKGKFYRWLEQEQFDFIHLNSFTLVEMIDPHFPFIQHVREIVKEITPKQKEKLQQAKGVICIDQKTRKSLGSATLHRDIILNNPFQMDGVKPYLGDEAIYKEFHIKPNETVFSILGNVISAKGVREIITAFKQVSYPSARLLIVGDGEKKYLDASHWEAKGDPRIVFHPGIEEIEKIYAISDYIVRGDPHHAIGRTIFEGLYSGCGAIIPGKNEDVLKHQELSRFSNCVWTYPPRDVYSLTALIEKLAPTKIDQKNVGGNAIEYARKFYQFVLEI